MTDERVHIGVLTRDKLESALLEQKHGREGNRDGEQETGGWSDSFNEDFNLNSFNADQEFLNRVTSQLSLSTIQKIKKTII